MPLFIYLTNSTYYGYKRNKEKNMRKLVSIQRIKNIQPIEGADNIVSASVLGWNCVVRKEQFCEGDLCVYFEIDSFLPEHEFYKNSETFSFLVKTSFKSTDWQGNGYRIRTQKLRGRISQGVAFPISVLKEIGTTFSNKTVKLTEGEDVTDIFGVEKFDPPEFNSGVGKVKNPLSYGIYKTDETRIQASPDIIEELRGKPYYITSKMDGTSVTMYTKDNQFGITGHEKEFILDDDCLFYLYAKKYHFMEKLQKLNKNIAFQGEFCGPGIQENRCGLKDYQWYVFNIQDLDTLNFLPYQEFITICKELNIATVPIVETGEAFHYTEEELLEKADGLYPSGKRREGIVIRPQEEMYSKTLNARLSFKVINNKYLLKNNL